MILLLHDTLFAQPDGMALKSLFQEGWQGPHFILLADDEPTGPGREWIATLDDRERQRCEMVLDKSASAAVNQTTSTKLWVVGDSARGGNWQQVSLAEVSRWLREPFTVMVEDLANDPAFLRAMATQAQQQELKDLEHRNYLKFGATSGINNLIRSVAMRSEGGTLERARCFYLFDSDAPLPGEPSRDSQRLAGECQHSGIAFHQLKRRSAENYLPPPFLKEWSESQGKEQRRRARVFAKLKVDQQSCYAMRDGLSKDQGNVSLVDQTQWLAFWSSVSNQDQLSLKSGFGGIQNLFTNVKTDHLNVQWDGRDEMLRELQLEVIDRILGML